MRKRLKLMGLNDELTFKKIEDIIIKTVIAVEPIINNANEMYCPLPNQCFELFGFDILIDDKLEPWLLEVNLTPALGCDSPLDQKIKSNVIADLLSMAGVIQMEARIKDQQNPAKLAYKGPPSVHNGLLRKTNSVRGKSGAPVARTGGDLLSGKAPAREATKEEKMALKDTEDEFKRRNFFKRIFPSVDFLYYKQFFEEERPLNNFLDAKLMAQFRDNNP
jgi:tubulin polyglutamylase TTLL5